MFTVNENLRILLYVICISFRIIPIYIMYKFKNTQKYFRLIYLIISCFFLYKFYNHNNTDVGFFGGDIWWNNLRIVHSIYYILWCAISMYYSNKHTELLLIFDLLIGIITYVNKK